MKLLLIFLLFISLEAIAKDNRWMNAKSKMSDETTLTKAIFKSPQENNEYQQIKYSDPCGVGIRTITVEGNLSRYITHVTARVNDYTVLDMYTGPSMSKHPIIKFLYKNIKDADTIKFSALDNKGLQRKAAFPIKKPESVAAKFVSPPLPQKKAAAINMEAFKADSVPMAIKTLYPQFKNPVEGKIEIGLPGVASNTDIIPVSVSSNIDLESIAVLSENTQTPVIAVFSNHFGVIDYTFKIRVYPTGLSGQFTITVIGRGRDGMFYKAVKSAQYAFGDCCGCV